MGSNCILDAVSCNCCNGFVMPLKRAKGWVQSANNNLTQIPEVKIAKFRIRTRVERFLRRNTFF